MNEQSPGTSPHWRRDVSLCAVQLKCREDTCALDFAMWAFPKIVLPPKSSILIGFSIINHPFGDTPIFGNTHVLDAIHLVFATGMKGTQVSCSKEEKWGAEFLKMTATSC